MRAFFAYKEQHRKQMVGLHYYTNFLLSSLANKIIDVSVCDILAYYNSFSTKVKKMITLFYFSILKMYKLIINNINLVPYYLPWGMRPATRNHRTRLIGPLCYVNWQQLTESVHFDTRAAKPL